MLSSEERDVYFEHHMKHINKNCVCKTASFNCKSDVTCNSLLVANGFMQRRGCKQMMAGCVCVLRTMYGKFMGVVFIL